MIPDKVYATRSGNTAILSNVDALHSILVFDVNTYAVITDPPYDLDGTQVEKVISTCTGNALVFCKPENQFFVPDEYLFWVKTPSTKNFKKACGRFVEMILVRRRGGIFNLLHWSQMTGIYDDRLIYPPTHPYEKPLTLIERLIRIYTNPGDTIFDPFMGSGTTAVACLNTGRNFIGCEVDLFVYEKACNRVQLFLNR